MKLSISILTFLPFSAYAAGGSFGYDDSHPFGPTSWAAVPMEGNQCGGSFQSGIDIPVHECDVYDNYVFYPGTCTVEDMKFQVMAHAIQADYVTDNCEPPRMQIPGQPNMFEALQFHIHTGSDHAVGGVYFGADLHLVHKELNGDRFSVLGFFLEPTSPTSNFMFNDLLTQWEAVAASTAAQCAGTEPAPSDPVSPTSTGNGGRRRLGERKVVESFNPYALAPPAYSTYTYDGSLTTPPCAEVVFWNVVDTPVSISPREFVRITDLILEYVDPLNCTHPWVASAGGYTGRPVQPLNGRKVTRHCVEGSDPDGQVAAVGGGSGSTSSSLTMSTAGALLLAFSTLFL